MKTLFCLLVLTSFYSFGQQKVYKRKVYENEILKTKVTQVGNATLKEAINPYKPLTNALLDEKNYTIILDVELKKMHSDFYRFASKRNVKFNEFDEEKSIPVELLVQPNGTIDYFVYGFRDDIIIKSNNHNFRLDDSLNAENEQKLITVAEEFCKKYRLPTTLSKTKFSTSFYIYTGNGFNSKKPSKMFVYNLEMAEACDKPDTVKTLMLNKLDLETFPMVVFKFKNLEKLDLSDNYIEKIPKSVSKIKNLKFLSISNNPINHNKLKFKKNNHIKDLNLQYTGIEYIPRSIAKNKNLEVLFLGNNRFKSFRKRDFKRMDKLRALNLYNARLSELPLNITKLKNLEELDLYYNDLRQLPNEICTMPKLKTLAVSNNDLWKLPENIAQLKTLETLYAHHNRLSDLPTLPNLKLLNIGSNLFETVPNEVYKLENIEEFDMTKNKIKEVPTEVRKFGKLKRVYFLGNDFERIAEKKEELAKLVTDLEKKDILVR